MSPLPKAKVMKREEAPASDPVKKPRNEITPPTTLLIPKSSTPSVCKTIREVYKLISTRNSIRTYSKIVFLTIRLLDDSGIFFFYARFAVTCPIPIHPKRTKTSMQGKRRRLFILQKYLISPKSQKGIPTK